MSAVDFPTKVCSLCGDDKPLSQFYKNRVRRDGLDGWCADCKREATKRSIARRRAEIGADAWKKHQRDIQRKYRRNESNRERNRQINRRIATATRHLRERHRDEYEHLLLLAKRGEIE